MWMEAWILFWCMDGCIDNYMNVWRRRRSGGWMDRAEWSFNDKCSVIA